MTQQNTTERNHAPYGGSEAGQENRPKKRRRRRPQTEGDMSVKAPGSMHSEPRQDKMAAAGQAGAQQDPGPAVTASHGRRHDHWPEPDNDQSAITSSRPEETDNAAPQAEPPLKEAPQTGPLVSEALQAAEPARDAMEQTVSQEAARPAAPSDEPKTTVTNTMDYQEAYQEIYRDILENLRSFSPSDQVACSITPEHISEYLDNSHKERVLQFKERREKRFFAALELIAVLAAVVLVIHYLQNNSAILVNILYIIAGLGALFLWKFQPRNDDRTDKGPGGEIR